MLSSLTHQPKQRHTLALFGGTFDPVHVGHVETVAQLQKDLQIDQIRWVLSAQPPHRSQPKASIEQRLIMLDLALEAFPAMVSDDVEVRRQKLSYTIDTLEYFRKQDSQMSIVLIVGSDIMHSFHKWHRSEDILKVANIVVMDRAGYSDQPTDMLIPSLTENWQDICSSPFGYVMLYPAPAIPVSATKVREAFLKLNSEQADSILEKCYEPSVFEDNLKRWLNPKVLTFIQKQNLYT